MCFIVFCSIQLQWHLHTPWQAPLILCVVTAFIYKTMGVAVFAAMAVFCVLIPLQCLLAERVAYHR